MGLDKKTEVAYDDDVAYYFAKHIYLSDKIFGKFPNKNQNKWRPGDMSALLSFVPIITLIFTASCTRVARF